jgi:3-oxoacyl-[acyl-carrier protein] reductase
MNRIDLQNRCAIVTGGARGIGLAVTERFAASGARVSIWDLDGDEAKKQADRLGQNAIAVDVTSESSVQAAVAASASALGQIDILVTSAGITGPNTTIESYPAEDWRRVIEVDLTGPFL